MNAKQTYYLLSGEGDTGTWTGPIVTTERGIKLRATIERCHGDRWCKVWLYVPTCDTHKEHILELDSDLASTGNMRDVPTK